MKNNVKYLLYICNMILTMLIVFNIMSFKIENKEEHVVTLENLKGRYISYLEIDNIIKEIPEIEKVEYEESINTMDIVIPSVEVPEIKKEEVKVEIKEEIKEEPKEEKKEEALETLIGNLVGYGPDCYGCTSFKTASGKYIGDGNIYYEDSTYGKVRIVAGDYSYPFGTIVKISNVDFYNDEPFYAVVLDRGGNIGKNKKFLFDLLFATESEASNLGKEVNIKFEIMRLGY